MRRNGAALAAGFSFALALAYVFPALWSDRILFGTDTLAGGFAFSRFVAQQLSAGVLPSWVPYVYGGLPLFANPGSAFYPPHLLASLVLPTEKVFPVVLLAQLVIAMMGMRSLALALGCRRWVALVGAVLYAFTGVILSWVYAGHDGRIIVATLAPWVLAGLYRGVTGAGGLGGFAVAAAALGGALLSFQLQNAWYLLWGAAIWTAAALWTQRHSKTRRALAKRAAWALLTVGLGFATAAIDLLPFARYAEESSRGGAAPTESWSTVWSMEAGDLLAVAVPEQMGASVIDPRTGVASFPAYRGSRPFKLHTEYLGALTVLLLALGAVSGAWPHRKLLVGLTLFFLSLALGSNTPLYPLYLAVLPGLRRFRAPDLAWFMVALCLTLQATLILETLAIRPLSPRRLAVGLALAMGLVTLGASGAALWGGARTGLEAIGWLRFGAFFVACAALVALWQRGRLPTSAVAIGLLVLATADLWVIGRRFFFLGPTVAEAFAPDEVTRFLQAQAPGRVWVLPIPGAYRHGGNALMVFGIEQLGGEHPLPLRRWLEYVGQSDRRSADWHELVGAASLSEASSGPMLRLPLHHARLDAAHARFIVSPLKLEAGELRHVYEGAQANIYENPRALPFAMLALRAIEVEDGAASLQAMASPDWDPRLAAVVETEAPLGITGIATKGATKVVERSPSQVTVSTRADGPTLLVLAQSFCTGWSALLDGSEVPIRPANHALQGVAVPAGEHVIRLRFRPTSLVAGAMISGALGAFWVALGVIAVARGFRSRREAA